MARIPKIQAERLPEITAQPEAAGRVWREAAGLGREVRDLGLLIAREHGEVLKKKKALRMAVTLSEIGVDINKANESLIAGLRLSPDPDTYYESWEVGFNEIIAKRLATVRDEETLSRATVLANQIKTRELVEQEGYANVLFTEAMQARTLRVLDYFERHGELEAGIDLIDNMADGGIYKRDDAEKLKQAFRDGVNVNRVRAGINVDPSRKNVQRLLKEYPIPPEKAIFLQERAEKLRDRREREQEKAEVNAVYSELKRMWGDNYGAMLGTLRDREYQKNAGITGKQVHDIAILLTSEQAIQENRKKKLYNDTATSLYTNTVFNDETTQGEKIAVIDAAVDNDTLSWQLGEHFRSAVANPPAMKSDPGVYNSVLRAINLGADDDALNAKVLASRDLSNEDKMELGRRIYAQAAGKVNRWVKEGESLIEGQIIPKRGLMEKITRTPQEELDYYTAVKHFHTELNAARAAGKPIEGLAILDKAKEVALLHRKPLATRLADVMITYQKEGKEVAKIMRILSKGKKYKTIEEVKEAYDKGDLTYDEAAVILRHQFKVER